jgi:beta-glucosidase
MRSLPFLWGVATSSHQIEGGNTNNDWWDWEQIPGKIRDGTRSGDACASWERWAEDLDLIRGLGLNAYRLSIEWSRIEPAAGRYDDTALQRYRAMLEGCRTRGITPIVTLHHFTNPRWFAASGGWEERANLAHFERYARHLGSALGDLVDLWITINEPEVFGFYAYDAGLFPPGMRDRSRALAVIANLLEAHGLASQALRDTDRVDADGDGKATLIGAAKHWVLLEPKSWWSTLDNFATWAQHRIFNIAVARALTGGTIDLSIPGMARVRRTVDALAGSSDFLGVNYYTRWMVSPVGKIPLTARKGTHVNDLGWEIYPEGIERALAECARFGLPLLITENGLADVEDLWRPDFIRKTLAIVDRVRGSGVDIRGYMHWSLLDNFEWMDGRMGRFGLYEVDFDAPLGPRVQRESARVYAEEVAKRLESAAAASPEVPSSP